MRFLRKQRRPPFLYCRTVGASTLWTCQTSKVSQEKRLEGCAWCVALLLRFCTAMLRARLACLESEVGCSLSGKTGTCYGGADPGLPSLVEMALGGLLLAGWLAVEMLGWLRELGLTGLCRCSRRLGVLRVAAACDACVSSCTLVADCDVQLAGGLQSACCHRLEVGLNLQLCGGGGRKAKDKKKGENSLLDGLSELLARFDAAPKELPSEQRRKPDKASSSVPSGKEGQDAVLLGALQRLVQRAAKNRQGLLDLRNVVSLASQGKLLGPKTAEKRGSCKGGHLWEVGSKTCQTR